MGRGVRKAALVGLMSFAATSASAGGKYHFTVSCPDKEVVVEWRTGDLDPGREYLRVATGTNYPGCSVGNYDPRTDSKLRRERHSHAGGVVTGLKPVVTIVGAIFGGLSF